MRSFRVSSIRYAQIFIVAAAFLFALALLAAGQSASIVATVAGQAVSEGFLRWRVSVSTREEIKILINLNASLSFSPSQPIVRRLLTRLIGLVPSMVVAIAVGRPGIDALLVASQVVLSIVLPFIIFPLLYLTSSKKFMQVRVVKMKPTASSSGPNMSTGDTARRSVSGIEEMEEVSKDEGDPSSADANAALGQEGKIPIPIPDANSTPDPEQISREQVDPEKREQYYLVDFSSGKIMTAIGIGIWLVVLVANGYVIVTLGMGQGG